MDSNNLIIERETFSPNENTAVPIENDWRFGTPSILLIVAGLLLIVWASLSDDFRRAENIFSARFCLPLAIGAAMILNGIFIHTRLKNFALWLGLSLIGQAAALQMIDAGRLIHFQHYRPFAALSGQDVLPLCVLAAQIILVAAGVNRRRAEIRNWLAENFKLRRLIFVFIFLTLAGAAVTMEVSIYATSLLFAAVVQSISAANIALAAWSVPNDSIARLKEKFASLFSNSDVPEKTRLDRFSIGAALLIVALAGFLSFFVYENHPHVPDETQYLFQAKYFAAGQLTVAAPPVPEAFAMYMTPQNEARWFSLFPPGWSAILAIGVKFDCAWLINPLLAGICVLLAYLFFQEIYSRRFARLAVSLLCCSPWFIFTAMSFMSHMATLACALGAAVALQTAFRKQNVFYVFAAGLLIGMTSLIRPLDAAIIAVLLGLWTLYNFQTWGAKFKNALILIAGTILTAGLVFPYNRAVTGDAALSPMDFYYTKYFWSGVTAYGFGAARGMGWGLDAFPGHSPLEAAINSALNVFQLNTELFGWGCGSLIFIVCLLFGRNLRRKDFWALAAVAVVITAYAGFWYHGGPDFGARYWFLAIIPLAALTVSGIEWLGRKLNEDGSAPEFNPRVVLCVALLCATSLVNYLPWRTLDKYFRYLEMQPGIVRLAEQNDFGKSLVLIRGAEHPDYQSAWIYNPLNFEGDAPIYARDVSPETTARLREAYASRPLWIVDGPTRAGGNYRVIEGPIPTDRAREINR